MRDYAQNLLGIMRARVPSALSALTFEAICHERDFKDLCSTGVSALVSIFPPFKAARAAFSRLRIFMLSCSPFGFDAIANAKSRVP